MAKPRASTWIALVVVGIVLVFLVWLLAYGQGERAGGTGETARRDGEPATGEVRTPGSNRTDQDAGEVSTMRTVTVPLPPAAPGRVFARAAWGNGPGELARARPAEANPEAPMSLAEGPDGTVVVLDQVNGRLVRFDREGRPIDTVRVGLVEAQDVSVAADGTVAVLDRLVDRKVALYGPDGREIGRLGVEGEGIPEGGGVTAVIVDGDDVYLERENGPLVRVGDTSGTAAEPREEVPGRPTRDGLSFIMAGIIDAPAGRFFVNSIERATRQHRFTRDVGVPMGIRRIVLLDTDAAGIIYVGVTGVPFGAGEDDEQGQLLCFAPVDGTTIGSVRFPVNTDPDETRREMIVLSTGGVLYSQRSDEGVALTLYDCRSPAR